MKKSPRFLPSIDKLYSFLRSLPVIPSKFMEVCGTHTVAIFRAGIRQTILKEKQVDLVSGPGCPVCVTSAREIEQAAEIALKDSSVILTTYGDMLKVRGKSLSFAEARERGASVRVVLSPLENLAIARDNPNKRVLFFSIGFETTQPSVAHTVLRAKDEGIKNFFVFASHKLVPPILKVLAEHPQLALDGFILPGHVSTIIGEEPYRFLAENHKIPSVIAGFEPEDVLYAVTLLLKMKLEKQARLVNIYREAVRPGGNAKAKELINRVFEPADAYWRGIGAVPGSGQKIKNEFAGFDAHREFAIERVISDTDEFGACRCGEVLLGLIKPIQCKLFGNPCTPQNPLGACMVSMEGTCANYFKYGERR